MPSVQLSDEQKAFVDACRYGAGHVLVDACIGSGKTTAIQRLCSLPEMASVRTLYLTYSKLLKEDARAKIELPHVMVTNYHGYAYGMLRRAGVQTSMQDCIRDFNRIQPYTPPVDMFVIDEYQDIRADFAAMLNILKQRCPSAKRVMVGDLKQKLYDDSHLDVAKFVGEFLDHNAAAYEFTKCFRLGREWAAALGDVWDKAIIGVNPDHEVMEVSFDDALDILSGCEPRDVLCLGSIGGQRDAMLNELERLFPDKYNKSTCWAKTQEHEGGNSPSRDCAVFTTYDGSKGMERDVCAIFDWTESYWNSRLSHAGVKYEIMRNIFCVAASRGKRLTLLVKPKRGRLLDMPVLKTDPNLAVHMKDCGMKELFAFKMQEDLEECFQTVAVKQIQAPGAVIDIPASDEMIDLSACIGMFMEASYFDGCDIDRAILRASENNKGKFQEYPAWRGWPLAHKVLYLMYIETHQFRYFNQVSIPFVTQAQQWAIRNRLAGRLKPSARAQVECIQHFYYGEAIGFEARGVADIIDKDNTVIELKFTNGIAREHILQCAMYLQAMFYRRGIVWNVRSNEMVEVTIPDRKKFLTAVGKVATKGYMTEDPSPPPLRQVQAFYSTHKDACRQMLWDCRDDKIKENEIRKVFRKQGLYLPVSGRAFVSAALKGKLRN